MTLKNGLKLGEQTRGRPASRLQANEAIDRTHACAGMDRTHPVWGKDFAFQNGIYLLHSTPLVKVIRCHGLDYHLYAGDT